MLPYTMAFCILLILSVFHFALAAPVAVREILEVQPNAVDAFKDGIAAWEKRMDLNDEDQWSTNVAYLNQDDDLGSDSNSDDAPGGDEEDVEGWVSSYTSSDARGPDPHYNHPPDSESGDDGDNGNDTDDDNGSGSYEGDTHNEDDAMESEQAPAENTPLTSPGPASEHPPTPERMPFFEKLLKGSLRPRNSGSDAVGMPKRELQGTVDTKATMVRARATSTRAIGRRCSHVRTRSPCAPPKPKDPEEWMPDRLDWTME